MGCVDFIRHPITTSPRKPMHLVFEKAHRARPMSNKMGCYTPPLSDMHHARPFVACPMPRGDGVN